MDTNDLFTTQHVISTFKVSHQTVKNWCDEFNNYLSPQARPGDGKKRFFNVDDLKVFALVNDYHKRGLRWEDVHLALRNNQRGDLPDSESDIVPYTSPALLISLKDQLGSLTTQLKATETERDMALGQVKLLEKQVGEKDKRIQELYQENAELRVKSNREEK
jgi:DNA-binding transcriptional MerR regulator